MLTMMQAEGLLNALRDTHECDVDCSLGCVLEWLEPALPADREMIATLARVA